MAHVSSVGRPCRGSQAGVSSGGEGGGLHRPGARHHRPHRPGRRCQPSTEPPELPLHGGGVVDVREGLLGHGDPQELGGVRRGGPAPPGRAAPSHPSPATPAAAPPAPPAPPPPSMP